MNVYVYIDVYLKKKKKKIYLADFMYNRIHEHGFIEQTNRAWHISCRIAN
jgi:hypothetical protein